MPVLIKHIDAIARKKQRDLLFLEFAQVERPARRWQELDTRRRIIAGLDAMGIGWTLCGAIASGYVTRPYAGQIYIDVAHDPQEVTYQALQRFLEYPDGALRF